MSGGPSLLVPPEREGETAAELGVEVNASWFAFDRSGRSELPAETLRALLKDLQESLGDSDAFTSKIERLAVKNLLRGGTLPSFEKAAFRQFYVGARLLARMGSPMLPEKLMDLPQSPRMPAVGEEAAAARRSASGTSLSSHASSSDDSQYRLPGGEPAPEPRPAARQRQLGSLTEDDLVELHRSGADVAHLMVAHWWHRAAAAELGTGDEAAAGGEPLVAALVAGMEERRRQSDRDEAAEAERRRQGARMVRDLLRSAALGQVGRAVARWRRLVDGMRAEESAAVGRSLAGLRVRSALQIMVHVTEARRLRSLRAAVTVWRGRVHAAAAVRGLLDSARSARQKSLASAASARSIAGVVERRRLRALARGWARMRAAVAAARADAARLEAEGRATELERRLAEPAEAQQREGEALAAEVARLRAAAAEGAAEHARQAATLRKELASERAAREADAAGSAALVERLREEADAVREELASERAAREADAAESAALADDAERLRAAAAKLGEAQREREALEAEVAQLRQEAAAHGGQAGALREELASERVAHENEVERLRTALADEATKSAELVERLRAELGEAETGKEALAGEVARLREAADAVRDVAASERAAIEKEAARARAELQRESEVLADEVARARTELASERAAREADAAESAALADDAERLRAAAAKLGEAQREREALAAEVAQLRQEAAAHVRQAGALREELASERAAREAGATESAALVERLRDEHARLAETAAHDEASVAQLRTALAEQAAAREADAAEHAQHVESLREREGEAASGLEQLLGRARAELSLETRARTEAVAALRSSAARGLLALLVARAQSSRRAALSRAVARWREGAHAAEKARLRNDLRGARRQSREAVTHRDAADASMWMLGAEKIKAVIERRRAVGLVRAMARWRHGVFARRVSDVVGRMDREKEEAYAAMRSELDSLHRAAAVTSPEPATAEHEQQGRFQRLLDMHEAHLVHTQQLLARFQDMQEQAAVRPRRDTAAASLQHYERAFSSAMQRGGPSDEYTSPASIAAVAAAAAAAAAAAQQRGFDEQQQHHHHQQRRRRSQTPPSRRVSGRCRTSPAPPPPPPAPGTGSYVFGSSTRRDTGHWLGRSSGATTPAQGRGGAVDSYDMKPPAREQAFRARGTAPARRRSGSGLLSAGRLAAAMAEAEAQRQSRRRATPRASAAAARQARLERLAQ